MRYITTRCGFSSRTDRPLNPSRRRRADFARQATIAAFGWRYAKSLDEHDFIDRRPGDVSRSEARFR